MRFGATPQDVKPQQLAELTKPTGALTHASIAQAIALRDPGKCHHRR